MSEREPFFTTIVRGFTFDRWRKPDGGYFVTATREGSGICGTGETEAIAEADFEAKQEALLPLPKPSPVIYSGAFEPTEYGNSPTFREED